MNITEVRIKLMEDDHDQLLAFCSITFDKVFVVENVKIIKGSNGIFVAMPSRRIMDYCPKCSAKNPVDSHFCDQCGERLNDNRASYDHLGRPKLYADIVHPINSACRKMIQTTVLDAYKKEKERSKQSGYVSSYDSYYKLDGTLPMAQ